MKMSVPLMTLGNLAPCTHEEADKRQILACSCILLIVLSRDTVIISRTSYTDVVVLAISLC